MLSRIPDSTYRMGRKVKGAGVLVHSSNGWMGWRDEKGRPIVQCRVKPADWLRKKGVP